MQITIKNLFDVIPDLKKFTNDPNYCSRYHYQLWEKKITPIIESKGFKVIKWFDGERDSFGPLTRICSVMENNVQYHLIYG